MSKKEKIKDLQERLALYKAREKEMLTGGVQSYGVGTRSATRYNTDLAQVRAAIKEIEAQISALECKNPRKAVGVIPRDW
ncbi:MAG: hypothetical protein MRZ45_09250 [Blautia sp.]|nr:hypothetical protein [Blautia sp.]